jgi:hypothetical protein
MRGAALIAVLGAVLGAGATARAETTFEGKVDAGGEVDTNIHRVEVVDGDDSSVVTAPVMRGGGGGELGWRGDRTAALIRFAGIGKLFLASTGSAENVAVIAVDAAGSRAVGGEGARLGVAGSYYNAVALEPLDDDFENTLGRNFVTSTGELTAAIPGPERHRVLAAAGYRDFVYKPNADFDWRGEHVRLTYANDFWLGDPDTEEAASIELSLGYVLGRRNYEGMAFANGCSDDVEIGPECFVATENPRGDLHHVVSVESSYVGARIYSARYQLQITDSNSFGQSRVRQRFDLSITSEIPRTGIFATLKVAVLFNHFLDPLLLARDVDAQTFDSIEDENRNALILHATRDIGEDLAIEARYALFTNEFATDERRFRRQTVYGGLVYRIK